MTDKDFINKFREISVRNVCNKINCNYYNVMSGRASYSVYHKVAQEIEKEIKEIINKRNSLEIIGINGEPIDNRTIKDY